VVGVIVNLALFFAYHVFSPQGLTGQIDWLSVALTALATIAIFKYKANVILVIAAGAILGMAWQLLA